MKQISRKTGLLSVGLSVIFLGILQGCQPSQSTMQEQKAAVEKKDQSSIVAIQAKVEPVVLKQAEHCDESSCTRYDLQTTKTNYAWIDDYFLDRIQKANPVAFESNIASSKKIESIPDLGMSQTSDSVRFIGQRYNLATFVLKSYSYSAGAAHGLYHDEYVNLDLNTQKRLSLQNILKKGAEQQVVDALYDANATWLENHNIERSKLQLSDNFYFGVNGIVFVYPLYELASYAEGMSELTLPYMAAAKVIKAEYLPSMPKSGN